MDFEIVVPTTIEDEDDILTLDSIPDGVPVHIEREGTLNEARNRGVRAVESRIVVVMDDDISFTETTLNRLVELVDESTVVGLVDYEYGLLKGRVMAFETRTWRDIGGFNELLRSHMGDTEFCISALKNGYSIRTIADDYFEHQEHERSITTFDRLWRLVYLAGKHPLFAPLLFTGTIHHNVEKATLGDRVTEASLAQEE